MNLRALDTFEVTGRGTVIVVQLPPDHPLYGNPRALRDTEVTIDHRRYLVRGVETFAVPDGHSALKGPCGLLVDVVREAIG